MLKSFGRIVFILLFLFSGNLYALSADDIQIINDGDYFRVVHQLLQGAQKSIYLMMFSIIYYDKYTDSPSNILLNDLAGAVKRGVDVKVVLEQEMPESGFFSFGKKILPEKHRRVIEFFKSNNIPYALDEPETTTHAKIIIIDGIYTVIGSANWSYSALTKNHETNVIIKSKEIAREYTKYFLTGLISVTAGS